MDGRIWLWIALVCVIVVINFKIGFKQGRDEKLSENARKKLRAMGEDY